jgi:hypothetical protein
VIAFEFEPYYNRGLELRGLRLCCLYCVRPPGALYYERPGLPGTAAGTAAGSYTLRQEKDMDISMSSALNVAVPKFMRATEPI